MQATLSWYTHQGPARVSEPVWVIVLFLGVSSIYWTTYSVMDILLTPTKLRALILEELTRSDKSEIRDIVSTELDKKLKSQVKKVLEDELSKALNSKSSKEEIGEITKKVLKKLYKDISYHHPYIIDRIKV